MADIVTIDIGNSNIVIGLWSRRVLKGTWRIETKRDYRTQELEIACRDVLSDLNTSETAGAIIASVVPEITMETADAIEHIIGKKPLLMGPFLRTGIDISDYDGPRLGMDRIVDLSAARALFRNWDKGALTEGTLDACENAPVMVCDLGTCTTITVADRDGILVGGMICAGVQLSLDAQAERTSLLPQLKAESVDSILGRDTRSNMLNGAVAGTGLMITGIYDQLSKGNYGIISDCECDATKDHRLFGLKLVITGGLGKIVIPWIKAEAIYEPDLLIKGLLEIYEMNSEESL